jgi:hypothetical protein
MQYEAFITRSGGLTVRKYQGIEVTSQSRRIIRDYLGTFYANDALHARQIANMLKNGAAK